MDNLIRIKNIYFNNTYYIITEITISKNDIFVTNCSLNLTDHFSHVIVFSVIVLRIPARPAT